MKIKRITSQHRRDFNAIIECEHCSAEEELKGGYDDDNYHRNIIPTFKCKECGLAAGDDYRPIATKHAANAVV